MSKSYDLFKGGMLDFLRGKDSWISYHKGLISPSQLENAGLLGAVVPFLRG